MTNRPGGGARSELERRLQRTPRCISFEQFGTSLTEADRDHMAMCTRCQAEFALWHGFTDTTPHTDEEDAAVRWITAELRQRRAQQAAGWVSTAGRGRRRRTLILYVAASFLLVAAVGYIVWDPEPRVSGVPVSEQTYRTARVQVVTPSGELAAAPTELQWMALEGAVRYDVRVFEVDGAQLWRSSTADSRIPVPAAVVDQFVPGKTIVWDVTALNRAGEPVAASGRHQFRVTIDSRERRD